MFFKSSWAVICALSFVGCGEDGESASQSSQFASNQTCDPRFDLNEDGNVDSTDLAVVLAAFSETSNGPAELSAENRKADLDGNGVINGSDVGELLGCWSPAVP